MLLTRSTNLSFYFTEGSAIKQIILVVPLEADVAVNSDVIKMDSLASGALLFLLKEVSDALAMEKMVTLEFNLWIFLQAQYTSFLELLFEVACFSPLLIFVQHSVCLSFIVIISI